MLRVLVVEDNPALRGVLVDELVLGRNAEVFEATNGEEGLFLWRTKRPDIVITDYQMPEMDGVEMLKALRAEDANVRVLMLTANAYEAEELSAENNIVVLTKPYHSDVLNAAIDEILS